MKKKRNSAATAVLLLGALPVSLAAAQAAEQSPGQEKVQTLRLVQDDAQDYMVSKIYHLKFAQANDVSPFLQSIVKRYNMNSSVSDIGYGANNSQMLTVTCPVKLMPYVDDFVKKIDRDIKIDGKQPDEIIKGTGITRAVYQPRYRSGQNLLNVLVNAEVGEGPYGSVYGWDSDSNQIYWKDNKANTEYTFQFLSWIDRPSPQITFVFKVYEVRESTMRDLGIEYLAWKNGPGLNLFQTAFQSFSISSGGSNAVQAMSGPLGGLFFAPQFDASFIRILAQSGNAEIRNTAVLTALNSDTAEYSLYFNPELQNIVKNNNDQTSVIPGAAGTGAYNQLYLKITAPIVNLHYGVPQEGFPDSEAFSLKPYQPNAYTNIPGTIFFGYDIQTANAVERNNLGTELIETSRITSNAEIVLNEEIILAQWEKEQEVEQTIGVPFLSSIPILKYLFSTMTTMKENTKVYLTVTASILEPPPLPAPLQTGTLTTLKGGKKQ